MPAKDGKARERLRQIGGELIELADHFESGAAVAPATVNMQPKLFVVVENSVVHGPMTEQELKIRRWPPCNLVFDATRNELVVRHREETKERRIDLARPLRLRSRPDRKRGKNHDIRQRGLGLTSQPQGPGGTTLEILRVMMECPGRRFTEIILGRVTKRHYTAGLFAKYVERLRILLGDRNTQSPFILTDAGVETSVSETGRAYYTDPKSHYRVIRYWPEVS